MGGEFYKIQNVLQMIFEMYYSFKKKKTTTHSFLTLRQIILQ